MNRHPEPRLARLAALIGDPTRARMLAQLLDGSMATAGELAHAADVTPQTASAHLVKLLDAELIAVRAQGRHRYFRLADGDVAHALEALAIVAERDTTTAPGRDRWSRADHRPLREARSCYGHLAGRLGVCLHDTLLERKVIVADDDRFRLGEDGRSFLARIGLDAGSIAVSRTRGLAYPCVDWSERRDHFAGPLPVALLEHFLTKRWMARMPGSRALGITAPGRRALADVFGRSFEMG